MGKKADLLKSLTEANLNLAKVAGIAGIGAIATPEEAEASFIGQGAKIWNKAAHEMAEDMAQKGASRDEIWKATGEQFGAPTYIDVDGKWKQEISDKDFIYSRPEKAKGAAYDAATKKLNAYRDMPESELKLEMELMEFKGSPEEYREQAIRGAYNDLYDISGSEYIVADVQQHAGIQGAYPSFDVDPVKYKGVIGFDTGTKGSFNPYGKAITLTPDYDDNPSVYLHEQQHKIQEQEGFAGGGNFLSAEEAILSQKAMELRPFNFGFNQYKMASDDLMDMRPVEHFLHYKKLSNKDGLRPSSITNSSYFYEHSDEIRRELGAMPKKKGFERDNWLQGAARIISEKIEDDMGFNQRFYQDMIRFDGEDAFMKKLRKREREVKKHLPDYKEFRQRDKRYDVYHDMSDFEKYRRLAGEAEARNVQKRMDYDMKERIDNPPWKTLDVPEEELIVTNPRKVGSSMVSKYAGDSAATGLAQAPQSVATGLSSRLGQGIQSLGRGQPEFTKWILPDVESIGHTYQKLGYGEAGVGDYAGLLAEFAPLALNRFFKSGAAKVLLNNELGRGIQSYLEDEEEL